MCLPGGGIQHVGAPWRLLPEVMDHLRRCFKTAPEYMYGSMAIYIGVIWEYAEIQIICCFGHCHVFGCIILGSGYFSKEGPWILSLILRKKNASWGEGGRTVLCLWNAWGGWTETKMQIYPRTSNLIHFWEFIHEPAIPLIIHTISPSRHLAILRHISSLPQRGNPSFVHFRGLRCHLTQCDTGCSEKYVQLKV